MCASVVNDSLSIDEILAETCQVIDGIFELDFNHRFGRHSAGQSFLNFQTECCINRLTQCVRLVNELNLPETCSNVGEGLLFVGINSLVKRRQKLSSQY